MSLLSLETPNLVCKCSLSESLSFLVDLVSLWKGNIVENFVFMLLPREMPCTRLVNSVEKQEECVMSVRSDANVAQWFVRMKLVLHEGQ
jgi:hypothetical protein